MSDFGKSLSGKVAIITGACQGIGRRMAHGFAEAGAVPVIAERNAEAGRAVAAEIGANRALIVETDVGDMASLDAMAKTVLDRYGRIDVLVNNAGIFSKLEMRPFWQIPVEEWTRVMHVNATGPFLATRAVLPAMMKAKSGRIIHMSSAAVTMGRPNYLHYIASKSALIGMTHSMAHELGGAPLVDLIVEVTGYRGEVRWDTSKPDGQPRRMLDTSRARERFGFEATTGFREGLQATVRWYESQRSLATTTAGA